MIDIVIPNNNEQEFIAIAERLGYKGLLFLYPFNDFLEKQKNNFKSKIKIKLGILADDRSINKIKNKVKDVFVAVKSSENDREIIESGKADIVFSFGEDTRRDFIHQRASGLNHVLCKFAKENKVAIGFSFNSILRARNRSQLMGRISQNIKLCRKYKVKTTTASFSENPFEMRVPKDLMSLFVVLGMGQKEVKDSLKWF